MDLTMQYKGKTFGFELFTDRRGKKQLWLDQKDFQEWKSSTKQMQPENKQQEEYEFYTAIRDALKQFECYELYIDEWNTPEPDAPTLNWYIDDREIDEEYKFPEY